MLRDMVASFGPSSVVIVVLGNMTFWVILVVATSSVDVIVSRLAIDVV